MDNFVYKRLTCVSNNTILAIIRMGRPAVI